MVQFTKIRLSGFKSFVDATELLIEGGLTGIVGPNGCGKSNLLEALRWAMGETAPKKLRGAEMDDVIFGGSADRPARNLAEVAIHLNNRDRTAPAPFNDSEEIEIVRRIERGAGSHYRINGKEVRARDVQLVFADAASGARSTGLVSQGRIGALINAKPTDRRGLLEEAAGVSGLHSRRHEAELRLRAAESNLERLDDVLTTFADQLRGLKRQARQASRYRNISGHIRKAEAMLLHLRWQTETATLAAARTALAETEAQLAEQARLVARATSAQVEAAGGVPDLRQKEAAAAAQLQRLNVALDQLAAEDRRVAEARRTGEERLAQVVADSEREAALIRDGSDMLARLEEEVGQLETARDGEAATRDAVAEALRQAGAAMAECEEALAQQTREVAALEARRVDIAGQLTKSEERRARLERRAQEIAEDRKRLARTDESAAALAETEVAITRGQAALDAARTAAEAAETARAETRGHEDEARAALQREESALARLRAEEGALSELLETGGDEGQSPLLDAVTVTSGYETALGAALGDDLSAPVDESAPVGWHRLPALKETPPLPDGAAPLAAVTTAPDFLSRRLSQTGVVADAAAGERLIARLRPGQRLVSRDGGLWRWDGYVVAPGAQTAAAVRLAQRNRLDALKPELRSAEAAAEAARAALDSARETVAAAVESERAALATARQSFADLNAARDRLAEIVAQRSADESRRAALAETAERLDIDIKEARAALSMLREAEADLPDMSAGKQALDALRHDLGERRGVLIDCRQRHESLEREAETRRRRLETIAGECASWRARVENGEAQMAQLTARREAVEAEIAILAARPAEIARQRDALRERIAAAEETRKAAADRLAEAESRLAEVERRVKAAEARLADLREQRGLAEGSVRQSEQACGAVAERIAERLGCGPEDALEAGGVKPGEALPELEAVETRLARLIRERDNMGPVNLRAEAEAEDLQTQIESLEHERSDLTAAIGRFRQAIAELNREGRERILASFAEVDRHFQDLFARLFGGGRAHLKLTESDDPLEAGLEIMASPPGKRLQVLSLLSGGEQALTALALMFAVFLTNPAPICVLDEVDAPFDDANVDRVCTLLSEIARSANTRFLTITHHRMTMARMDRLFGVTMPERGISQLVSVDLRGAERLREAG